MAILLQATAATLVAGIVGAFLFFRLRQTHATLLPSKQNDLHLLYPRFILLEALSDQIHKLPSLVSRNEWYPFVSHFTSILNKILEHERNTSASKVDADKLLDNDPVEDDQSVDPAHVAKLSEAIDQHLVTYLQSMPEISCLVEGYLPQRFQSWMEFLNTAVDPQELEPAINTKLYNEAELMTACIQLVKGMVERIKGYRVRDTRRGTVNINELPPPAGYRVEKVFYATDRQVTEDCEYLGSRRKAPGQALDNESDDNEGDDTEVSDIEAASNSSETPRSNMNGALHYGVVLVGVPSEHHKGKVEEPESNEEASPLSHVVILAIDTTVQNSEQGFVQMVRSDMLENKKLGEDGNEVLLYIHGYNVRFKDAAKRAAQVKCDIQFQGALICYSWASKGSLFGYKHDAKAVKQTVDSLAKFLRLCFTKLGATKVHILAHSMGNRALIAALDKVLTDVETAAPLRNVILAAADERRRCFEKLVDSAAKHKQGPHFTVYCSFVDVALRASRAANWRTPLGDIRSYLQLDDQSLLKLNNVDTIDVTGMDLNTLHHSYYGDVPEVLQDIHQLLKFNYGAKQRAGPRNSEGLIKNVTYRVHHHVQASTDFYLSVAHHPTVSAASALN
ncbi:hypothetical protein SELMODRAFT_409454 [Selaginella moellendorffii]|uniref:Uncharacterized protein n=1 Tax=Selaginella moellendorffii TaxID=88036 RepID=D8RBI1_SELML|nr:hypothetical protein SELMODRAFT_409454 [Selaginella moellendorffii]